VHPVVASPGLTDVFADRAGCKIDAMRYRLMLEVLLRLVAFEWRIRWLG
jgi:hypothetical protein